MAGAAPTTSSALLIVCVNTGEFDFLTPMQHS
jgi:hypothetical protein